MSPNRPGYLLFLLPCLLSFFLSCQRTLPELNTIAERPQRRQFSDTSSSPLSDRNIAAEKSTILDVSGLEAAGWTKAFEDNFSGDSLDETKWQIWLGGAFNNELQYYQESNIAVEGGTLAITARKETVIGATYPVDQTPKTFNYTSSRIECKQNISANVGTPKVTMVARIKLAAGTGMWPAFWSYGDNWPTQGEIDVLEARGQSPFQYETNYFYGNVANSNLVTNEGGFFRMAENLTEGFHEYAMTWEKNSFTSFFDGKLIEKKYGSYIPDLFGKTQHIVFNLAVGGNFFVNLNPESIETGTMYVDWVKVFTSH